MLIEHELLTLRFQQTIKVNTFGDRHTPLSGIVSHVQSIICIDRWMAVVLSLTKSDFAIPSCGPKEMFSVKEACCVLWDRN